MWKRETESVGTNTRIDGSGRSISRKGISKLFTPSAQRGATATAARCITHPSMLRSPSQRIGFFNHPICQWSDRAFSPPLHLFLLRKGDRQISPRKLPAQMTEAMASPQKPVGPMFYDANIGSTGYIVRIQLRLRSFGIPVCFCFHLHRKWQALKSGSLSASDG